MRSPSASPKGLRLNWGDRIVKWLLLDRLQRFEGLSYLLLRLVTGAFLIFQSQDNVFSTERMKEFELFLEHFGFWAPDIMAPLCVWTQFLCGIAFVLGLFTRLAGLLTIITFIVAVWMVHWPEGFAGWWPALILVFLGNLFASWGGGRYSLDAAIEKRSAHDRNKSEAT